MRGYLAISDWAKSLGQKARERFCCRYENGRSVVPSLFTIGDILIRVDPLYLDRALQRWNQAYGQEDESLAIEGKTITADALLTQKDIANYLVEQRNASYHFTVKGNQPGVFQDIALYFEDRQAPDFIDCSPPEHGRIEVRKIWTTTELNDYLNFPHVGQAFVVQREFT